MHHTRYRPDRRARPVPNRARRRARAVRRLVPSALVAVVVAVAAVLGALVTTAPPAAAATTCSGPLAAGQIRVVLVVDPGETGPRGPLATCLVVDAGTPGSKILAQRAAQLGLPGPRYAASGLLCGLDGFPATGCPVNEGGSYAYWAYFNGAGGTWSYGRDNPFVRRMVDGEIMGWRYTAGSPDGAAPAPRLAPSSSFFPPLTPAPAPAPTPTAPSGSPAGGGATGGAPALPDLSGLVGTPGADGAATTVPADGATAPAGAEGDTGTDTTDGGDGGADGGDAADEQAATALDASPASTTGAGPGRWLGPAVAIAAAGALGVGAVTRTRRRARAGS